MQERDNTLDFLKGIACIFMILAHYQYSSAQIYAMPKIISCAIFIGGTAPVIFFAVSGVTATFQSKKDILTLIIFYTIFSILGFSYNIQWRPNLYKDFASDVPQIIAMSVIIIVGMEKYVKPNKFFYLIVATLIFYLHYFVTKRIAVFPFKVILFAPGLFTLIPWLSMFFLGVFAYRVKGTVNLIAGVISFSVFLLGYNKHIFFLDKLNMSLGYFILSSSIIFFTFYFARTWKTYFKNSIIQYIGKNSLLFLYVHLFVIQIIKQIGDFNILVSWVCVLLLTYVVIVVLNSLNKYIEEFFNKLISWIAMVLLICIFPLFISNFYIYLPLEMLLGILFSLNYSRLSLLLYEKGNYIKGAEVKL